MRSPLLHLLCVTSFLFILSPSTHAQTPACDYEASVPRTPQELEEAARRQRYREQLSMYQAMLPNTPEAQLSMPVAGVSVSEVTDTWGAPRGTGRTHEGQDIFAPRGTPIYAAAPGYVYRMDTGSLGGKFVFVAGAGGRRYYYAHLEDWAEIEEGMFVTVDTVLGFVGNSGNALTTPPHLHFGVYSGSRRTCNREVFDPLPMLVDRE